MYPSVFVTMICTITLSILIDDLLQNANNTEKGLELNCFPLWNINLSGYKVPTMYDLLHMPSIYIINTYNFIINYITFIFSHFKDRTSVHVWMYIMLSMYVFQVCWPLTLLSIIITGKERNRL